ncbi:hypothetical protein FACS18942_03670 [Planctomycetales bacterium]|nr:hypothetical protein FACS18942_03670 [Planctomycetales bacterium]GHT31789.1 hypothetical protein FACS1894214_3380 [Planctomycetales bacterium]
MKHFLLLVVLCSLFIAVSGCQSALKPSDLPKLYPCTLTITQKGQMLAGAVVELIAQDTDKAKYVPLQRTGEKGVVVMTTYGFDGVPAGKYKVVITKNIEETTKQLDKNTGETIIKDGTRYRTVEAVYSGAATTPLEIEITGKERNVKLNLDAGKAVKQKI